MTGKVKNSTGHASNGAIARADSAPATSAMAARFHPHDRMIASPAARSLFVVFTASRLHRRAAGSHCHWPVVDLPRAVVRGDGFRAVRAPRGVPSAWG